VQRGQDVTRRQHLTHRHVEFIPKNLDEGVLYISRRFNTASHLCCCGCGERVATPLNPAKWHLTEHGSTVSLSPSIGLSLPCRSHYWIRQSLVVWCADMTDADTFRAQRADEYASKVYTGEILFGVPTATWWERPLNWLRSIWNQLRGR
jgi:hypothetical protein